MMILKQISHATQSILRFGDPKGSAKTSAARMGHQRYRLYRPDHKLSTPSWWWRRLLLSTFLMLTGAPSQILAAAPGVTDTVIRIGSTMSLEGDNKAIGQGVKMGIEAALKGERVQNRTIELIALNDFYNPDETVKAVNQLLEKGVFLMLGSTATATTRAALPILAQNKIPAVGFYTGAGFTGPGDVFNFRPPYAQEMTSIVEAVLAAGIKPEEICAYIQNDGYGNMGIQGIISVLTKHPNTTALVETLNKIKSISDPKQDRNNLGPIGTYERDTLPAKAGYDSLKHWEKTANVRCRFVATVGNYLPTAQFIAFARYKGEKWAFSVLSPSANDAFVDNLKSLKVTDKIIATQVVPALDSPLPIVADARKALGSNLNMTNLEGYIVGKMALAILRNIDGTLTQENFLKAARKQPYNVGGVPIDFTTDSQGSDFVLMTYVNGAGPETEFFPNTLKTLLNVSQ